MGATAPGGAANLGLNAKPMSSRHKIRLIILTLFLPSSLSYAVSLLKGGGGVSLLRYIRVFSLLLSKLRDNIDLHQSHLSGTRRIHLPTEL